MASIKRFEDTNKLIGLKLITDSQDVNEIFKHLGKTRTQNKHNLGGVFAEILDGEYGRVYAFTGSVPYEWRELRKIN